jgi:predicted CXXCH cytochrome family protein
MPYRLGLILALAALICFAEDAASPGFLRPYDQTIVPAGPLAIVARAAGKAELKLDGKPLAASQPAPTALTATINPNPGRHELTLRNGGAEQKIQFFVRSPAAPQGWAEFKQHPPAASCETCHAVKDGAWSFKTDVLADTCFGCPAAKQFPAIHSHNSETLADCQMCHNPHGSTVKAHLKMRKELACKQSHS